MEQEKGPGYVPGGVVIGRIVRFVPPQGQGYRGSAPLAAIITKVWGPTMVNLTVFPDGTNDFVGGGSAGGGVASSLIRWETSVAWDPKGETSRSWHFAERV